jgi:hypothetical protein
MTEWHNIEGGDCFLHTASVIAACSIAGIVMVLFSDGISLVL